jgi:hypothetical protein
MIGLRDSETIAQKAIIRRFLGTDMRSQLRLEYRRTVIAEIDNLADRVIAEKVPTTSRLPSPCILDVMDDGSHRYLWVLLPVTRTTILIRMANSATRGRTAIAHDSLRESYLETNYPLFLSVDQRPFMAGSTSSLTRQFQAS